MLSLKEYIKNTLESICEGVGEANGSGNYSFHLVGGRNDSDTIGTRVNFEVALGVSNTIEEGESANAKIGVLAGVFGGAAEGGKKLIT